MPYKNYEKRLSHQREYYQNNKEARNVYSKIYRNTERAKSLRKIYCKNNKEKIYEKNKKWQRDRYKKTRQYINDYKLSKGCAICGYNKCAEVLDFHHKNNGDKDFCIGYSGNMNLIDIKKEMEKCIILCSNCHRELHSREREC